jgi:hypothetical protein
MKSQTRTNKSAYLLEDLTSLADLQSKMKNNRNDRADLRPPASEVKPPTRLHICEADLNVPTWTQPTPISRPKPRHIGKISNLSKF